MIESTSAGRRVAGLTLKLSVSAGILYWLFQHTDLHDVAARARAASPAWLLAALALYGLMIGISAWRWQLLLHAQGVAAPGRRLTASWLVATFFNNFLPSNIGGDVIRIADTVQLTRSRTVAASVVLVDRAIGLAALLVVAAVGAAIASAEGVAVPARDYLWLAALGSVVAGLPALFRPHLLARLLAPIGQLHPELVGARMDRLLQTLERMAEDQPRLWQAVAGALAVQLVLVAYHLAIANAIGVVLPWRLGLVIVPVSLVLQMAPVSVNGFGVREAVFTYFFARLGLPTDAALALSLLSAALVMLFSLSGGLVFLFRRSHRHPLTSDFAASAGSQS
jgi:uncharacterized membrane protein YbhN (UPF0104 family)